MNGEWSELYVQIDKKMSEKWVLEKGEQKSAKDEVLETKGQFHQRSTRSFYASSLTPVEYKAKM